MADSFFGFDTSSSNLNDDEGGGEPSEDEYDALNDETFGQDVDELDWEVEHEQLAHQLESNRRYKANERAADQQLEASLSQLVLDETDAPQSKSFSTVWKHDQPFTTTPAPTLKNVCTVEELERQLRQKQHQPFGAQSYFQPRFPPVILQRPPGLQAPVPLPFAPQQTMNHMNQPLNKIIGQNTQMNLGQNAQMNPSQNNLMQNHLGQNMNQMGQNINQLGHNMNQLGPNMNQLGQNVNQFMQMSNHMGNHQNNMAQGNLISQLSQNLNVHQMGQGHMMQNQMGQNLGQLGNIGQKMQQNPIGPKVNPLGQNMNQMNQNMNQMGQNMSQMGQGVNQMSQNLSQMGQSVNQMGQNVNQIMSNGNQFPPGMNQYQMMGQPRMIAPPPGLNMPRQNFTSNIGQYNPNFRPPSKPDQPLNQQQQNMLLNQQLMQQQMKPNPMQNQPNPLSNATNNLNQRTDKQKTRVYNNSMQQKSMTSQNLVQLIQNTHPMLQYNNSFHNANHHPMLGRNNNMFGNQLLSNHLMGNQRHNGAFSNNGRQMSNGDDADSDADEYAGLMTQREKQWLINIQMLQLNTGTPYIHDFYYTVFLERQANKEKQGVKEAHKANQQNHPFYCGGVKQEIAPRERHNSLRHNSSGDDATARNYVPLQFENSLGKLQCGSVTAPRKIIDVELVAAEPASARPSRAPSVASTTNPAEVPRELKRTKQLLLDIESMYLILLRLEELNDPLAIANALILREREEKQKLLEAAQKEAENELEEDSSNVFLRNIESVQRRPKQDSPKSESIDKRQVVSLAVNQKPVPTKNLLDEDKDELVNKMFAGLLHGDRIQQMLTVRKGRQVLCRFLPRASAAHPRLRPLWARLLRALPSAARRDLPLAPLALHYTSYIQHTNGWSAILESCSFLSEAVDPARTPYSLTSPFTLSCVCTLVDKACTLVNTPDATSNERQWSKFLKTFARALKNTTLTVARPIIPLPESKLIHHMKQLDSRTTIEILQRGRSMAETELTKTEVTELLLKHLC